MSGTAFTIATVHADKRGEVTRWDMGPEWEAAGWRRVKYTASHRCIGNYRGDDYEYGVAIVPPDANPHAFAGYDTQKEAVAALEQAPHWPDHRRDHARALR